MTEIQGSLSMPSTSQLQTPRPGRPSILHKLDLLLHYKREKKEILRENQIHISFSTASYIRGGLELLCLAVSLSLEVYRINETSCCFYTFAEYKYAVLVAFCAVLATLSKVLIFFIRWTKKARSFISEVRFNLWKAVIATSYCSHNIPILLVDPETCKGNSRLFSQELRGLTAVQWFVIGWYSVLISFPILLFILTKCAPKSFATMRNSESWFWTCLRIAQGLEALLYVFALVVMVSLLDSGIGIVYAELVITVLYLGYTGYLLCRRLSQHPEEGSKDPEIEQKMHQDKA